MADVGEVGSFNLAPFFVTTNKLEHAGKVLTDYLVEHVFEQGFNMDLCPEDVKEAMKVFGYADKNTD